MWPSPVKAPATIPPVFWEIFRIERGTTSEKSRPQVWRWISMQAWKSATEDSGRKVRPSGSVRSGKVVVMARGGFCHSPVRYRCPMTTGIDFRRYRKVRRFVTRVFIHVVWWDVVLNVPGLRRFRRPALARYQEIARRYRNLAGEMGGVLIKIGQFLSTRVDLLPTAVTRELAGLQDEV